MTASETLVILFGGESSERKVSVASAQNLAQLLPQARCWFWALGGAVHEIARSELLAHDRVFERELAPSTGASWPSCEAAFASCMPDTLFVLALHGVGGEDGQVQTWLEARRLCFTGSGAAASRRAFDKVAAKRLVAARGGRVAASAIVRGDDPAMAERVLKAFWKEHGRAVLKPVADGSSNGLTFIDSESSVMRALAQLARAAGEPHLVEAFVEGTELTVGVFEDVTGLEALPVSEVRVAKGRAFDYAGKYLGQGTREITPAEVSDQVRDAAQALAIEAHRAVGCLGYSRTDMIVDADGPVFLEINNLPGLTKASFIPQQLAAAGIPMSTFLERQLTLARNRYGDTRARHTGKKGRRKGPAGSRARTTTAPGGRRRAKREAESKNSRSTDQ